MYPKTNNKQTTNKQQQQTSFVIVFVCVFLDFYHLKNYKMKRDFYQKFFSELLKYNKRKLEGDEEI